MSKWRFAPSDNGILVTPRSPKPSSTERAYAAGLTDGEGCVSIIKQSVPGRKNPTYRLRLDVVQNDFQTLVNFVHCVGVATKVRPVKRDARANRQVWRIGYDGPQAYEVLTRLHRYLVRKKPESRVAMDFVEKGRIGLHPGCAGTPARYWKVREACYRKLKKLK
ncbi:MAG: hypothetical protein J0M00_04055 [Burkholderiales bacterium]|nr:hypothetical protein [Burkholderiales bacterium]